MIPLTYINEYLLDDGDTFAGKVTGWDDDKVSILDLGRDRLLAKSAWGINAKNIYQGMAMDALLDPTIDLVILTGPAGSGKTGITSTIISIFVQTSINIKLLTMFFKKKNSLISSIFNSIHISSNRILGGII
jgi:PhoH-like ATPase